MDWQTKEYIDERFDRLEELIMEKQDQDDQDDEELNNESPTDDQDEL